MSTFNIEVCVGSKKLVAVEVPDVYEALSKALPIVVKLFSSDPSTVSDARDIHKMVGGTYRYRKWLELAIADCRLVEGRDFFTVEMDPSTEEGRAAIAKGQGVLTYLTLKASRKVVIWANKDESHLLYDYLDAVADAVTPRLLAEINKANAEALLQKNRAGHFNALLDETTDSLNRLKLNGDSVVDAAKKAEQLPIVRSQLGKADSAARIMWETLTKIEQQLKAGKAKDAQHELEYPLNMFGKFDDFTDSPWLEA